MKNNCLILGKGFIGGRLSEAFNWPVSTQKIFCYEDILSQIKRYNPKILINCVGYTGANNVDGCELNIDKTLSANTFTPILLAEAAIRNNLKLIHISSGCIYHYDYTKQKPISESRRPDYYDLYYSRTKIYTENILTQLAEKYNILIVRIRIPLDNKPHPKNILTKLLKYKTIIGSPNSVTYIPDFMKALRHLIKINATGVFNVVCKGSLKYNKLLDIYKRYIPNFQYQMIPFEALKIKRTNLVLSTRKLEKAGFKVRPIETILEECVKEYIKF